MKLAEYFAVVVPVFMLACLAWDWHEWRCRVWYTRGYKQRRWERDLDAGKMTERLK